LKGRDKMIEFINGEYINKDEASIIKQVLKTKFVGDINIEGNLMWNLFNQKPKLMSFVDVKSLQIPNYDKVYFYLERQDKMYKTEYSNILKYVEDLEPWEEIDGYIFDHNYNWVIAITHEDNQILVIGL
jgi:hypothetical protein